MNKIVSIIIAISICIGVCALSACGSNNPTKETSSATKTTDTATQKIETTKKVETTATPTIDTSEKKEYFLERLDYIESYEKTLQSIANTQSEMNNAAKEIYDTYDELLNEVYSYLKEVLPSDKFSKIESDEADWIQERDNAISEAASELGGGSMIPMVMSSTGARETKERIEELLEYL